MPRMFADAAIRVRVPEKLRDTLEEEAARRMMTMSQLVRTILAQEMGLVDEQRRVAEPRPTYEA